MNLTRTFRKLAPARTLSVLTYPDARLAHVSEPVDLAAEHDFDLVVRDMAATMHRADGAGLAAIQVGIPKRFFVFDDSDEKNNPRVFINPILVSRSEEHICEDEGCLSFPGLYKPVERAAEVTVAGLDLDGSPVEVTADGLLARILQHELDHLDGINFVTHLCASARKAALREYFDLAPATAP